MRAMSAEAIAAWESGDVLESGAVWISGPASEFMAWGGYGPLDPELVFGVGLVPAALTSLTFTGMGDRGLIDMTAGALGGSEQGVELRLSGVDTETLKMVPLRDWQGAPVVIWQLTFNGTGSTLLDAGVVRRGRIDDLPREDVIGGESVVRAVIEGPARGLGRASERMRSDPDQRLISSTDGGFKFVTHAAMKRLQLGGERPMTAGGLPGSLGPGRDVGNIAR